MMQPNVEHPYEILVIIRPSLKKICNNDACQAAAFNHILYWIARKAKGQPKEKIQAGEFFWYGTTEAITEDLANSWGVCKVRHEVNNLLSTGLLGKGRNKQWGADRTKFFHFGKEQCAKLLELCNEHHICLHHIGLPAEVLHLIISSNANDESIKCFCNQMMNPSNASVNLPGQMMNSSEHSINSSLPFDKSIEAITQITTQIDISDKVTTSNVGDIETFVASATPSHDFSNLYESFNDDPHQGNTQIIHHEHKFIRLDDQYHPTVMTVTLTPAFPHPLSSEMEDKRRERIAAWEVLPTYKKQGREVEVRWEHEIEQQTVDAAATVVESTVLEGGKLPSSADTLTDHNALESAVIDEKQAITQESPVTTHSENATPESPLQTQERPSSTQGVDESNRQAMEQKQANDNSLIAVVTTKLPPSDTTPVQPATKKARGGKGKSTAQAPLIVLAPEIPPAEAKWNEETAVQIIEAKKGRRYSDTTRSQEKSEAKKVLAMTYGDSLITREQFEKAVDDMISWPFWKEHTNVKPMIKTLRKDDKIITVLDDLQAKSKPKQNGNIRQFPASSQQQSSNVSSFRAPTGMIDKDEMNKLMDMDPEQRREYMLAKKQARLAQEQQQRAVL